MSRRPLAPVFCALLCAAVVSGCFRATYLEGAPVEWDLAGGITPGETTRAEVLALMGSPQNFSSPTALAEFLESRGLDPSVHHRYPLSDVFAYQLSRARLKGLTLLVYNRVDVRMDAEVLLVFFGPDDVVSYLGRTRLEPEE